MLQVQLFGRGQAQYGNTLLVGFPTQQCHGLMSYLMLNRGHVHSRERLAALFWGEYPTSTSRTNLRTCLHRLRQALSIAGAPADDYLCCANGSVSFPHSGPYWLDVEVFQNALEGCRDVPGSRLTLQQVRELEGAASLYTGDLLQDRDDDWCIHDRERLRLLRLALLDKLLAYHEHAGLYQRALEYGQLVLAQDPTRERVHRQVMRLYWLMGRPGEAMAQYRYCTQVLRDEVGVAPAAKTQLLYKRMLNKDLVPGPQVAHRSDRLPQPLHAGAAGHPALDQVLEEVCWLRMVTQEAAAALDRLEGELYRLSHDGGQAP